MNLIFLDTETTGLNHSVDRIVEIAVVDLSGKTIIDTLIDPQIKIPKSSTVIHGISNSDVRNSPTLADVMPELISVISNNHVVIYNADFDKSFFSCDLSCAGKISCAMKEFARLKRIWNRWYSGYKWHKLNDAAREVGHKWTGAKHRALSDALACRSIWNYINEATQISELHYLEYISDQCFESMEQDAIQHMSVLRQERIESRNERRSMLFLSSEASAKLTNIFLT